MRRWPCVLLALLTTTAVLVAASPAAAAPAWSIVSSPSPPSPPTGGLSDVACITTTDCFAVGGRDGFTLIERWNGAAWSVVTSPNPPTSSRSDLYDVVCTSTTNCVAVGSATFGGTIKTLVEQWNGSVWSIVASPNPDAIYSHLVGVACTIPRTASQSGTRFPTDTKRHCWSGGTARRGRSSPFPTTRPARA